MSSWYDTGGYYLHFNGCFNTDCASISIGNVVDTQESLILRLESVTERDNRRVDVSGAEAVVILKKDGMCCII